MWIVPIYLIPILILYDEFTVGVEDDNHRAIHIYKDFGFNEIIARIHEEYQGEGYDYNLYLNKQKVT